MPYQLFACRWTSAPPMPWRSFLPTRRTSSSSQRLSTVSIRNRSGCTRLGLHVRLPPLPVDRKTASFTFVVQPVTALALRRRILLNVCKKLIKVAPSLCSFFCLHPLWGRWLVEHDWRFSFKKLPRTPFTLSPLWILRPITSLISWIELAPATPQRCRRGRSWKGQHTTHRRLHR